MHHSKIAEFSFDLHNALGEYETPELDYLKQLGMAATLAVHIRGLGEINYEVLKLASFHYFKIPSLGLDKVIDILDELEFIDVIGSRRKIKSIIPKIPHFQSIYTVISDFAGNEDFNETEEVMLAILNQIYEKPENKQALINTLSADPQLMKTCLNYSETGGLVRVHKARGREIVLSPYYFADNLEGLADLTAKSGSSNIGNVINKLKSNQGWPLSLVLNRSEIGGQSLNRVELSLLENMAAEGILKPPSIKFGNSSFEQFVFTPNPGSARLNAANREIYERAMALVSCVRKGQLMPAQYRIKYPVALLRSFKNNGFIKSNSEANIQYQNLVFMKVATLEHVTGDRYRLKLINSEENVRALDIAIALLATGQVANLEVNDEAKLSFSKDETYIQSIISASEMRKRKQVQIAEEAKYEMDQLLLNLDA